MNPAFDIKVTDPMTGKFQFKFSFKYRSGENHGFDVTGHELANERDPEVDTEPYVAFLPLQLIPKTPAFTATGFERYVIEVMPVYDAYVVEHGVGERSGTLRLILSATDFLDEISITLTPSWVNDEVRRLKDQIVALEQQLKEKTALIEEQKTHLEKFRKFQTDLVSFMRLFTRG